MWPFNRKSTPEPSGATAVAERPQDPLEHAGADDLHAEIERLTAANRAARDLDTERRLLTVRHLLAQRRIDEAASDPQHPDPSRAALPEFTGELPEIDAADLTPELIRAGILRDGALLVRGLVPRDAALAFAEQIDQSFTERELVLDGQPATPGYYEEWTGEGRFGDVGSRPWIRAGGGVLAGDSPKLAFEMLELFRAGGFMPVVEAYLGEPPLISFEKTTLRKATPDVAGAWHQDGAFMGPVRALNLWLSLSRCGDESPGLDVVPRRLDDYVDAGGEGAMLSYQVTDATAQSAAGATTIVRPIFEPGDALFFDEKCLHQTASDPSMPNPRYAIESWFFGGSAFPEYVPIAV